MVVILLKELRDVYKRQDSVNALGGISKKAPFVMQTLADVLDMPIRVVRSEQTCATTPSSEGSMSWASRVSSTSMPSRTFCLASPPEMCIRDR